MKKIGSIEGAAIYHGKDDDGREIIQFTAKAAICTDGMPKNIYGDKHWQRKTAYQNGGKWLNADKVPYVVVPPFIISAVDGVILGSEAAAVNLRNGNESDAITGEVGPKDKIGEVSIELARRLGINPHPNHGGTNEKIVRYTIFVGEPAVVDGIRYRLQPATRRR